jgi:tetratricopeptide (TPR) repeat protein
VAGEAGIGKTRLLAAVASAARGRSFGVVRAAAFPGDSEASGGLLLDLASDLRAARDERAAEATAAMSAQLREPGGAGGDRHRRRRLLVQDLADAFGDLGGAGPLLVVLEDLHWADELSLEVVGHLAARLPTRPLLVAGAYRSDELYPRLPLRRWRARLLPQRLAEEIRLPRLDAAQTAALAGVLLGHPPPAGVAAAVHDIRDALYGDVPPGERRRLHRLVAAAAAGRGYGDAFVSAQFDQAGLAEPAYRHALAAAREASALSAHREALELYRRAERNLAADPDPREHAALLAAIGDEAAASDDNTAALAAYRQAHRLLAEAGAALDAAAVVARWSAVAHLLGEDLDTRAGRLEEALGSVPEEEGTRAVRAELLSGLAAAYMLDRQLDASIGYGERSLALAPADGDDPASLNTAATLGSVLVFAGRMDEGWAMLESAVGRAAEHRLEAEAARAYRMIGSCASVLVEYDRAERWLGEGVDYAERVEMWNHRHYMAAHLAHVQWAVGRWEEAGRTARQALVDGRGGITTRITAEHALGYLAMGRGDWEEAAELLGDALAQGERMAELQRLSPALWGLAETALLRGDQAAAVELCDRGHAASARVGDAAYLFPYLVTGVRARLAAPAAGPGTLVAVDHGRGLVALAEGDLAAAGAALERAAAGWRARRRFWEGTWALLDRHHRRRGRPAAGGRRRPPPGRTVGAADRARVRGRPAGRRRPHQPRDRRRPVPVAQDGRCPRRAHPDQARGRPPSRDRRLGRRPPGVRPAVLGNQPVEPPVLGLDPQGLGVAEPGRAGVAGQGGRAHDGAGGGRPGVAHRARQAGDDAPAVGPPVPVGRRGGELVLHPLVGDHHRPALGEHGPGGPQGLDRPGHVVQGLEDRHQVVAAGRARVGGVDHGEPDPAGQVRLPGVLDRGRHHVGVDVEAVHRDRRVRPGHGDARPAGPAGHVGHPGRRLGPQAPVDLRDRRQPPAAEQVEEQGPVELGPALGLPGQRRRGAPMAERLHHLGQRPGRPDRLDPP